jgi:hypothetical protein
MDELPTEWRVLLACLDKYFDLPFSDEFIEEMKKDAPHI